jgi:hypothetical protein
VDEAVPSGAAPGPQITDPPDGRLVPGADPLVTVSTNAPGLPLELLLLAGDDPGRELARAEIAPGAHPIPIPLDPRPGQATRHYLAVGVRGDAAEQYRHLIPVTTGPSGE